MIFKFYRIFAQQFVQVRTKEVSILSYRLFVRGPISAEWFLSSRNYDLIRRDHDLLTRNRDLRIRNADLWNGYIS